MQGATVILKHSLGEPRRSRRVDDAGNVVGTRRRLSPRSVPGEPQQRLRLSAEARQNEEGDCELKRAMLSAKLVKNADLKIYKGGSHGICTTEKDKVNADLLGFIKA